MNIEHSSLIIRYPGCQGFTHTYVYSSASVPHDEVYHKMGLIHMNFTNAFTHNSRSVGNLCSWNYIPGHQILTGLRTWHQYCSIYCQRIWMAVKRQSVSKGRSFAKIMCPHNDKLLQFKLHSQYWWPGDAKSHGIISHVMVLYVPQYSILNAKGVTFIMCIIVCECMFA